MRRFALVIAMMLVSGALQAQENPALGTSIYSDGKKKELPKQELFVDKIYGAVVKTISANNVGKGLQKTGEQQKALLETRTRYQLMFPNMHLVDTKSEDNVRMDFSKEIGQSVVDQVVTQVSYLQLTTASYKYKFNLFTIFEEKEAVVATTPAGPAAPAPTAKTAAPSAPAKSSQMSLVSKDFSSTQAQEETKAEESSYGAFQAQVTPNVKKQLENNQPAQQQQQKLGFDLQLAQEQGFYTFTTPVQAQYRSEDISHQIKVPLNQKVSVARKFDYQGKTTETQVESKFHDRYHSTVIANYNEQKSLYNLSYKCQVKKHGMQVSTIFNSAMQVESEKVLTQESTKYQIDYTFNFGT